MRAACESLTDGFLCECTIASLKVLGWYATDPTLDDRLKLAQILETWLAQQTLLTTFLMHCHVTWSQCDSMTQLWRNWHFAY